MISKPLLTSLLMASVALSACATRTAYVRPKLAAAPGYAQQTATPQAASPTRDAWWRAFGDTNLDALVDRVLAQNNSLAQSVIAVQRARAQAGLSVINPTVSSNGSAQSSRTLGDPAIASHAYQDSLSVNYEVDLFQRLSAARDVGAFEAKATAEDYNAARLSLAATSATLYYQLASTNQRIALAEASLDYAGRARDIADARRSAGSASGLEAAQARQSLAQQQSNLEELKRQRVATRNALDLLLDGEAWTGAEPQSVPAGWMAGFDVGVPARLLSNRPDLRAAELRLREQLSQVDATRASFYPRLTLTGSANATSASVADLFSNPVGALGAGIALPFLQVNQMRLQNRSAQLDYDSAVVGFRQTFYEAAAEVENALADSRQYAEQARLLQESVVEARRAEALNEVLYRAGSVTLKIWLDAQETRRQAEVSLTQSLLNERSAQVTLFKALGGGAASGAGVAPG